jgi:hypothetical protein
MASPTRTARTELLREVLDVAIVVGRRVEAEGRGQVPAALQPVLTMARVGVRARSAADRAGDDETFRALVAEAVDVDDLDDAGRLWLTRPPGWEDELDDLVQRRVDSSVGADTYRILDRERRARRRAEADRDRLQAERDRLRTELARVKSRAGETAARARKTTDERAEAVRALEEVEAKHRRTQDELRSTRGSLVEAKRALAEARAGTSPDPVPVVVDPWPEREEAAAAAGAAAEAAADLARALDGLAADLRPPAPEVAPAAPRDSAPRRPRRRRAPLPGGIHDDSPEAAAHLVRVPGCVLLVDGYNATMATWFGRDLPEQRRRLVDGLDQLEARSGARITVVFDGVEEAWRRSASRRIDVRFTPAEVEADDVILDLVDALPVECPVVVASDDQRVRNGAIQRGAHAIGTAQLRSVLG